MYLTNSNAMRDADERAINVYGIPSTLLMSNAANAVAHEAKKLVSDGKKAVVFCGSGNNGGDGIAAASCLIKDGFKVKCFLVGSREKMTQDSLIMEERLLEQGGKLEEFIPDSEEQEKTVKEADVLIDAIFGIGLKREISGKALCAIKLMNDSGVPIVSADIPSGVKADTGEILGCAVNADITVTFSMAKIGLFVEPGCTVCGKVIVADIGIPKEIMDSIDKNIKVVDEKDIILPKRPPMGHKGTFGRLLIIGGCVGYTGAPVLCTRAAERAGAGLISLGVPESIYNITAPRLLSSMPFPLENENGALSIKALDKILSKCENSNVVVFGCGVGRDESTIELAEKLVLNCDKQLVLDADGLFAMGREPILLRSAKMPPVLTPHEGEFKRLGGTLSGDRVKDALEFAKSRNCVLVLKGHRCICAFPDGEAVIVNCGNPGMAKGGSGDVLAGIIGSLLCQLPLKEAVIAGTVIHARSGDLCAQKLGEYSMLPSDIIDMIPETMKSMTR